MPIDVSEEIKKILSEAQEAERQADKQLAEISRRLDDIYSGYAEYLAEQDLVVLKLAADILAEKQKAKKI